MKWLIFLYQKTLSPDHGPLKRFFPNGYCRFYPSCSEYSRQAFEKHGFLRGWWLMIRRILKCHPWHPPEIDHIPEK